MLISFTQVATYMVLLPFLSLTQGHTAGTKDIHVNLKTEITKNFDQRRRLRGAAIAVRTVNFFAKFAKKITAIPHANDQKWHTYVSPRRVIFSDEVLHDVADKNEPVNGQSECGSDLGFERSNLSWKAFESVTQGEFPQRRQSSPDIHSAIEKKKYFERKNHSHEFELLRASDANMYSKQFKADEFLRSLSYKGHVQPAKLSESKDEEVQCRKRSFGLGAKGGNTVQRFPMSQALNQEGLNLSQFVERDTILRQELNKMVKSSSGKKQRLPAT